MSDMPDATQIEQLRRLWGQIAALVAEYRDQLIESGFSREEAMTLCLDYQRTLSGTNES